MNRELTILLIEDNKDTCNEITHYVTTQDTVELVGITNSSMEALSLVQCHLPDAIILNLELHHGAGNGIQFLKELNEISLPFRPYTLVTTNNSSETTYEIAREFGADFIMYKGEVSYCASYVINFLQTIHSALLSARRIQFPSSFQQESPECRNRKILQRIGNELDLVGISRKSIAFAYLTDAVLLVMNHPECHIYTDIAQKYNKSSDSVEHAMRHAINRAWLTFPLFEIEKNYTAKTNMKHGAPTPLEFIYYYAEKIRNSMRN